MYNVFEPVLPANNLKWRVIVASEVISKDVSVLNLNCSKCQIRYFFFVLNTRPFLIHVVLRNLFANIVV